MDNELVAQDIYVITASENNYGEYFTYTIGVTFSEKIANTIKEKYDAENVIKEEGLPTTVELFNKLYIKYSSDEYLDEMTGEFDWNKIHNQLFTQDIVDILERFIYNDKSPATISKKRIFYADSN